MTAACAGSPLDFHSDDPAAQEACKAVCGGCELRASCLAGAIARDEPCGIWAGEVFPLVEMVVAHVRPAIFAPVHNRAHYVAGCREPECLAANARYIASWRATHTPAPVRPPVDLPLSLFDEIAPVTAPDWITA